MKTINRIDYKYLKKDLDFEIVDLSLFFSTRPRRILEKDYRINFWSMLCITDGHGIHHVDFNTYEYKSGDVIFVQKNQVHRYKVSSDVKGYIIHINEPFFYNVEGFSSDIFLEFMDRSFGSPLVSSDMSEGTTHKTLLDLLYKEYNKKADLIYKPLIASLFQAFILSLIDKLPEREAVMSSTNYEHFKIFRKLVEKHFMETRNVEDYANMMSLSKKTVNQATRQIVGLSAKEFIIDRVILEIKRYLSQGELLNYEIADTMGFVEAANMTKFFKHYEGVSPKEFKENLKSSN